MNMLNPVDYRRWQTQSDDNIIMNELIKEMCSLNNRSITYKTQQAILGKAKKKFYLKLWFDYWNEWKFGTVCLKFSMAQGKKS